MISKPRNIKFICLAIFLLITSIATFIPFQVELSNLGLSLTATAVLFSIFAAFSITERLSRIDKIRENDSNERSSLIMLNNVAMTEPKESRSKIHNLIEAYLIATMDYSIWDYYMTYSEYSSLAKYIMSLRNSKNYDRMQDLLDRTLSSREQTVSLISDRLSGYEWAVYIILGFAVVLPFILNNDGSFMSVFLVSIITFSVLLIMYFLYKLDSLEWKKEIRIIEPYQKTFEAIGAPRYYPDALFAQMTLGQFKSGQYRIAHYNKPYPDQSDKNIELLEK